MRLLRLVPLAMLGACIHKFDSVEAKPVEPRAVVPREFKAPVRVHLVDGSTVVFQKGVTIRQDGISGAGRRYDLMSTAAREQTSVPFDSVAAMVVFDEGRFGGEASGAATVASNAALIIALGFLFLAILASGLQ